MFFLKTVTFDHEVLVYSFNMTTAPLGLHSILQMENEIIMAVLLYK